MAGWFRRRQREVSIAQELADALGSNRVIAPVNAVHPAPTQQHLIDTMVTTPASGLTAALVSASQCCQLIPPGAVGNQTPLEVPVSGHNLVLILINSSAENVTAVEMRAVYTNELDCEFPAQLVAQPQSPTLVLSEDLRESAETAASEYTPLQVPHYEVHLGGFRPLITEALLPDGTIARDHVGLPLTISPGGTEEIVLAPVTHLSSCLGWRLVLRWQEDGADLYAGWDLLVTGYVGWSVHEPGAEPRPRPVAELGHWDPLHLWADGYTHYSEHLPLTVQHNPVWLNAQRGFS